MAYVTREKFNILELIPASTQKLVGLFETDYYLAGLYKQYLESNNFLVKFCLQAGDLYEFVFKFSPHVIVMNSDMFGKPKELVQSIKKIIADYPKLHIVTVGYNTMQDQLKDLMSAGIAGHMNRKLSRPQDLVVVIKSLLHVN